MEIVEPLVRIFINDLYQRDAELIEFSARTCYQSQHKMRLEADNKFIERLIRAGHESVIEHRYVSVYIRSDIGVLKELTRHRLASFSVESTRYCNYEKKGFKVINPLLEPGSEEFKIWEAGVKEAERSYLNLISLGVKPEIARSLLPHCLKVDFVMTANHREWRHIFKLRTAQAAHPQMRQIMLPLLQYFAECFDPIYSDFDINKLLNDDKLPPSKWAKVQIIDSLGVVLGTVEL